MKRILAVGGGSGGHVTPVIAVFQALKKTEPNVELRFWSDKKFAPQAERILSDYDPSIRLSTVISGKFRRYSHLSKLQHIFNPSIFLPNLRDVFYVLAGIFQSFFRLLMWKPDVVFAKGGFVCLPVGVAAKLLGIPLVIHDSDAIAGLTNRLLAPLATYVATGTPLDNYKYSPKKSFYVGIPIDASYEPVSVLMQKKLKTFFGFDPDRPLTVVSGGGQGSRMINDAVAFQLKELLLVTNVLLISGRGQYDELRSLTPSNDQRFILKDFLPGLSDAFRAADIVITRAGATTLLELASLKKPTILVPNNKLKWQVEHARHFIESNAVLSLNEDDFHNSSDRSLVEAVKRILGDNNYRNTIADNLYKFAKPKAAEDTAKIIMKSIGSKQNRA